MLALDAIVMLRLLVHRGLVLDVRGALRYTHNGHLQSSFVLQKHRNFELWAEADFRLPELEQGPGSQPQEGRRDL